MSKKEYIHAMKYRNSTHLAGADLLVWEAEGRDLIFEIEDAYYNPKENIGGKIISTYIIKLKGVSKLWAIGSTNSRKLLTELVMKSKGLSLAQAGMIENWKGVTIELYFDPSVRFHTTTTGGIRIKPFLPKVKPKEKPIFTEQNFESARSANATIEQIKKHYLLTNEIKEKYEHYMAQ